MERLNSIESSLPPEQPPTKQAIRRLESDLSQEFKIAANAVTKLYRIANERNSLLKHSGYIDCIDDLTKYLQDNEDNVSIHDIKLWLLKQRNEILSENGTNANSTSNSNTILNNNTNNSANNSSGYNFNFKNSSTGSNIEREKTTNHHNSVQSPKFILSMPPLSVEHTGAIPNNIKSKKRWNRRPTRIDNEQFTNTNTNLPSTIVSTESHNNHVPSTNNNNNDTEDDDTLHINKRTKYYSEDKSRKDPS
ncbi:hypothetical protein TBLA_0B02030 [Henningerozyma blattae CBS 6284]|uniref:Uncharacterized protein n=1 Tax=Henningerozyma blattae (strain ATCC 34711 / CBS 6284 / DSM 70876 / NBRC 10599 / NRRL Y-10934 / UCD 77-7) TaxID=1071380 RepID=I2GY43_HENB6|nr:hypothetical protein TBLA_0B02030 [Tetrapisispora blattae CBS 6284]CCH59045.1 hypothetical protein TBLA_0B02030 [Tetrapisispora blattae CBS 6284]